MIFRAVCFWDSGRFQSLCWLLLGGLFAAISGRAEDLVLRGANGVERAFCGVFDATPEGLMTLLEPDGSVQTIAWELFDLEHFETAHPRIQAAYDRVRATGEPVPLGLGFASEFIGYYALRERIIEEIQNPRTQFAYTYSYGRTGPDGAVGETVSVTRTWTVNRPGRISPLDLLREFSNARTVEDRKRVARSIQSSVAYYNRKLSVMMQNLELILERLPPEKMLAPAREDSSLIYQTRKFVEKMREISVRGYAPSRGDQRTVEEYLKFLGLE